MIAHSEILSAAVAMAAAGSALLWAAPRMARGLLDAMRQGLEAAVATPPDALAGDPSPWLGILHPIAVVLVIAVAAAVVASAVQRRALVAPHAVIPSWQRIAPGARWRRLWSRATGFDLAVCMTELVILVVLVGDLALRHVVDLAALSEASPEQAAMTTAVIAGLLLARVIGALLLFGLVDLGWQHVRLWRSLWMSREDRRREHRDTHGHPGMRAHRRRTHAEILAGQRVGQG